MVFGTVASPCLAPVVGLIAVEIAKTGRIAYGASMLFTFGLGLGVLFLIIGTFSGALSSMPKAGAWMDKIKGVFGWLMLAIAAGYFFHAGSLHATAKVRAAEQLALEQAASQGVEASVLVGEAGPPPYTIVPGSLQALPLGAKAGDPAVDAPLLAGDNSRASLSALWSQRTLVLVFSAGWCKNCPQEVPHANEAFRQFGEQALFFEVGTTQASAVTRSWAGNGALLYRSGSFPTNIGDLIAEGNAREPSGTLAIAEETAAEAAESEAAVDASMIEGEAAEPGEGPYTLAPGTVIDASAGEGNPAPTVSLQDSVGGAFTLGDWRGQYGILLALYAGEAWEVTDAIAAVNTVAEANSEWLKVLGVSGATSAEEAAVWTSENEMAHDVVFDPDHAARLAFAPEDSRSPVFVFINLDGEIIYQGEWPGDDAAQELARTAAGE